jgi:hypothetical protein
MSKAIICDKMAKLVFIGSHVITVQGTEKLPRKPSAENAEKAGEH